MINITISQIKYVSLLFFMHTFLLNTNSARKKSLLTTLHNSAEITGIDKSLRPCNQADPCNCPSGFFIHIDDLPDPKGKCAYCNSFKTLQFPDGFTIGDDPVFPITVTLDWQYDIPGCDSSRMRVIAIKRR